MEKKKVYVETTVVSDATALPTNDLALVGRQVATREWWETASKLFDLFSSTVVAQEVRRGDPEAAKRRVEALKDIPQLVADSRAVDLATKLIAGNAVPAEYPDDALHIATAAINAMDYLVSWNFKHITPRKYLSFGVFARRTGMFAQKFAHRKCLGRGTSHEIRRIS